MKLSHNVIDITVEIVIYSSFNTSNRDPACILNERETRFASGMERDRLDLSRSIDDTKKFSNLSPEILVEWTAPKSINPLLTKLVRSRWLDIGLVLFLGVYGPRLRLGP